MQGRGWIAAGALCAASGVAAGAIGAHLLQARLTPKNLDTYEVAVRYQVYHALALVLVGALAGQLPSRWLWVACALFLLGILLFSGCLYLYLLTGQKFWAMVVPLGGTLWIVAWLCLAIAACKRAL